MQTEGPAATLSQVFSSLILVPLGGLVGGLAGLLVVRFLLPRRGMGWDQIADALGGMMIGGLLGLALAVTLCFFLSPRRRWQTAGVLAAVLVLTVLAVRILNPGPQNAAGPQEQPPIPQKTTQPADQG